MLKPDDKAWQALPDFLRDKTRRWEGSFMFFDELGLWDTHNLDTDQPPADHVSFPDLLRKANRGDADALEILVNNTRALCHELELLRKKNPKLVRTVASKRSDWPLVVSPKIAGKSEIQRLLKSLGVGGDDSFLPSSSIQKYSDENLWTRYAQAALQCLKINKASIPERLAECEKARWISCGIQLLKTVQQITFFDVGWEAIEIHDWQRRCVDLPSKLTKQNVPEFYGPRETCDTRILVSSPETLRRSET